MNFGSQDIHKTLLINNHKIKFVCESFSFYKQIKLYLKRFLMIKFNNFLNLQQYYLLVILYFSISFTWIKIADFVGHTVMIKIYLDIIYDETDSSVPKSFYPTKFSTIKRPTHLAPYPILYPFHLISLRRSSSISKL